MLPRYPLPYAFARSHGLLLENDDGQLTLWHSGQPVWDAWGEVMRKYEVRHIALAESGRIHVDTHYFGFEQGPQVLQDLRDGKVMGRGVLVPELL